jgi:CheY-like chemotaxis protein
MLELVGHEVSVAEDGPRGLELLRAVGPDVTLVDVGLPGMDGYEFARHARGVRPTYLVALTGYGRPEDRARALEAGFDLHLTKPVDPERLFAVLAR